MASRSFAVRVNPEVLVWARKSLGYKPKDVLPKLGLTAARLEKLESGLGNPPYSLLQKMSSVYKRPLAAFLLKSVPKEKPLPNDFRTGNSDELGQLHDKTIIAMRKARGFVRAAAELRKELGRSSLTLPWSAKLTDDPLVLAPKVRSILKVTSLWGTNDADAALQTLAERVAQQGVLVFQLTLTQDNLRGFSLLDEDIPVIVIKRGSERPTAKLFTLLHELGHVILGNAGLCDLRAAHSQGTERWCNRFAGEVLLPVADLMKHEVVKRHDSGDPVWTQADLLRIGAFFNTGPLVVLRRLLDAERTTPEFYKLLHSRLNNARSFGRGKGGSRNKLKEVVQERGKTFSLMALEAFSDNRITLKELSGFLDVKVSQIPSLEAYIGR